MHNGDQPLVTRLTSGIPGLDLILRGGFLRGGTYFIIGAPGTGKTTLAHQFCFHHVASEGHAIYLTLLAESYDAMVAGMQACTFFDPTVIGHSLHYFSAYGTLSNGGMPALLKLIQKIMHDYRPTVLVLDGFAAVESHIESDAERKHIIAQLQLLGSSYGCTNIVLTYLPEAQIYPEYTLAEGIIELRDGLVERRAVRELRVRKMRGTAELRGLHIFEISAAGLVVYPRLETLLAPMQGEVVVEARRLTFDIEQLDSMLQGGLPARSTTMLLGSSGSGKTLLGLHFLAAGARRGEPGLYLGFTETPAELVDQAQHVGLDLATSVGADQILLMWHAPVEAILDKLVADVLQRIEEHQIRRVVIDGLEGLHAAAVYGDRFQGVLTALTHTLQARGVTLVFTLQAGDPVDSAVHGTIVDTSSVAANMIVTRHIEKDSQVRLLIAIRKMRRSGFDATIRELQITDQGIAIADSIGSVGTMLTGVGHPRSAQGTSQLMRERHADHTDS